MSENPLEYREVWLDSLIPFRLQTSQTYQGEETNIATSRQHETSDGKAKEVGLRSLKNKGLHQVSAAPRFTLSRENITILYWGNMYEHKC